MLNRSQHDFRGLYPPLPPLRGDVECFTVTGHLPLPVFINQRFVDVHMFYKQVVRIRREAYPLRLAYAELYRRFRFLVGWRSGGTPAPGRCSELQERELCGEVCRSALEPEDFQLGSTRVFLK